MKSNIGFVFVVNSEKAFGRFVKESAGEEEMTSWKRRVEDFSSRATSNCRLDVESLVESETSLVKLFDKICRGSEFLIFYLVHQTKYLVFFLPPPQKNAFLYFSRRRLPIVSQSVTSAYIVRRAFMRAFTDLLSGGAQLGGVLFFILVSSVHY